MSNNQPTGKNYERSRHQTDGELSAVRLKVVDDAFDNMEKAFLSLDRQYSAATLGRTAAVEAPETATNQPENLLDKLTQKALEVYPDVDQAA